MAVRGDEPLRIKQRAGHTTFSTTEGYIREAENLRDAFGEVIPALSPLLEEARISDPNRDFGSEKLAKEPNLQGTEWRRRESNPGPKTSRPMLLRVYPMIYIAPGCAHRQALPGAIHLFDFA